MGKTDKGLVFFYDWREPFESLSGDDVKQLLLSMIDYSKDDTDPPVFEGGAKIVASFIFPALRRSKDKAEAGRRGMEKRWSVNNKVITQDKTKQDKTKTKTYTYSAEIRTVIDYLNEKAKTKYRASSDKANRHISARLNDGYTVDDMKRVVDIKVREWGNDPKMKQYLRPETLFGAKFDGYLNQTPPYIIMEAGDNDILPY